VEEDRKSDSRTRFLAQAKTGLKWAIGPPSFCVANEVGAPSFAFFAKEPALSAVEGWEPRTFAPDGAEQPRLHFSQNPREMGHPHDFVSRKAGHSPEGTFIIEWVLHQ